MTLWDHRVLQMLYAALLDDMSTPEPPAGLSRPLQALWWLRKGGLETGAAWERAHSLCQQQEGDPAHDLVHALAHWIEGDSANAAYWYRRVGGGRAATMAEEWRRIAAKLAG
jgi:hypothetical protein